MQSTTRLKRVSVTTTASVCKPTTRATWALLFWPTWPTSSVCKPTSFVVTERGLRYAQDGTFPTNQTRQTKFKGIYYWDDLYMVSSLCEINPLSLIVWETFLYEWKTAKNEHYNSFCATICNHCRTQINTLFNLAKVYVQSIWEFIGE